MKSLFRSIRMKLLGEGRVGRYLTYAIGEVLLIIVGILIALQINDWNQAREDAVQERQYLERLADDLRADITYFRESQEVHRERKRYIEDITSVLNNPEATDTELLEAMELWFRKATYYERFQVVNTTFEELSSTGNLDLIANQVLREKIVKLYHGYNATVLNSSGNFQRLMDASVGLRKETDFLSLDSFRTSLFGDPSEAEQAALIREHSRWLVRIMAAHHTALSFSYFRNGLEEANVVLEAIEAELDGN